MARRILDTPVVIFRGEDGHFSALEDRCPHRFAPLSLGRVDGNTISCAYHGLAFDKEGRCVLNPHGRGNIPHALAVDSYPLAEKQGMLWIWMGERRRAEEARLPDFPVLDEEGLAWVRGEIEVGSHYELVVDNLLDLSHVEFLHPFLATPGTARKMQFRAEQEGDRVAACYDIPAQPVTALFRLLWDGDDELGDMRSYMYWQAPSNMWLDTRFTGCGDDFDHAAAVPTLHLLTPQNENSTRYYWAAGRNRRLDDTDLSAMIHDGIEQAFAQEDEPIIRAVRSRMSSNDLFAQKPALLPIDEAAVRVRRILSAKIVAETAEAGDR